MIWGWLRRAWRMVPAFITAFLLALAVWVSAVTANDPNEEAVYPRPIPITVVGKDPNLILSPEDLNSVTLTLRAPRSLWNSLINEPDAVRAVVDLTGLAPGTYAVPVQIQIGLRPVRVVSYTPKTVTVNLERLENREMPVKLVVNGTPAAGYSADPPQLNRTTVIVSGPQSQVQKVAEVEAVLDISGASESLTRTLALQALDANGNLVSGLTLVPDRVTVSVSIRQRFGYRNVVVKVVLQGQVASGYRLTNIAVFPPVITVFSEDPQSVTDLPGYIETVPVDITNAKDDLDVLVPLNLPPGISVVGDQTQVLVRVGVAAIESSVTLPNLRVEVSGLAPGYAATVSPEALTVILSGPVALLDRLQPGDVRVVVNVQDLPPGTHQVTPVVEILLSDLRVESIQPETVEVVITRSTAATSTRRP
ncbi:CdaR family protein [Thermanaerothrix sp. 4228-RoL]|uniref:CdaR family protein n=1 Tax=Thermanaerothrix solaris TaxID=3058434 RepID=A0ABU3NSA9_9CHLR|nr:CdaR family protein [Thermanaerothrix sp. 4228-RoL]MDT8898746.1 CdaR family protein [Thermanaerothrix sp. 4228-RoL]